MCVFEVSLSSAQSEVTELRQWTSYLKYGSGETSQYFMDSGTITVH